MVSSTPLLLAAAALAAAPPSVMVEAAIFFDPSAVKHACVSDDGNTTLPSRTPIHLTDVDTTNDEQTILLKPLSPSADPSDRDGGSSAMCVLHRWTLTMEDKEAPL